MTKSFVLFTLFCFFIEVAYCQPGKDNDEETALKYAREIYYKSLSQQAGIYSGPDYIGYPYPNKDGHQFFFSTEPSKGDVYYDGMQYKNIPMWYDIARNEVIAQHFDDYSRISLHYEKIRDFSIFNHHFVKIDAKTSAESGLAEGFYDQLYKGKSEVLVKRSKYFVVRPDLEGMSVSFSSEKSNIFLRTGTQYFAVSSQKSVLKILGKYQKEIQSHLKQTKIKFRKEREKAIIIMVAHYDELNNQI